MFKSFYVRPKDLTSYRAISIASIFITVNNEFVQNGPQGSTPRPEHVLLYFIQQ